MSLLCLTGLGCQVGPSMEDDGAGVENHRRALGFRWFATAILYIALRFY